MCGRPGAGAPRLHVPPGDEATVREQEAADLREHAVQGVGAEMMEEVRSQHRPEPCPPEREGLCVAADEVEAGGSPGGPQRGKGPVESHAEALGSGERAERLRVPGTEVEKGAPLEHPGVNRADPGPCHARYASLVVLMDVGVDASSRLSFVYTERVAYPHLNLGP